MTFDKILDNNTLWAVRYDNMADNALKTLFDQWSNPEWLVDFFLDNIADLESYFKITDINQANLRYHRRQPAHPVPDSRHFTRGRPRQVVSSVGEYSHQRDVTE